MLMKNVTVLCFLIMILTACKKDLKVCKDYKQISGRESKYVTADVPVQQMRDTLLKYPQLEITQLSTNQYVTQVMCNVYYQHLPIFSDFYSMYKNNVLDTLTVSGSILKSDLNLSLQPTVAHTDAIKEGRKYVNFDHSCIAYQLGLYNKNRWQNKSPDYRLAWKISDVQKPYLYVIIDAANKSYLYSEGGRNMYFVD